jgi:NTE family protein
MRTIENLVFKGGGVLGVAYAGGIQSLDDHGLFEGVKAAAGTSAGSIMAALVSLRYSATEINTIARAIDFKEFGDHWNPLRIATHYGLYKGDRFLAWMKDIIKAKTGNGEISFSQLAARGFRELKVFATDLNTGNVKEFSSASTPSVIVAESLRASMAVPLFFASWQFSNHVPDDHIYVDGGTVYIYPINAFGDLSKTLGFYVYNPATTVSDLGFDELLKYVKLLYQATSNAQSVAFDTDKEIEAVTVKINDFGIPSTDLDITDAQKDRLYNSGKQATDDYLKGVR